MVTCTVESSERRETMGRPENHQEGMGSMSDTPEWERPEDGTGKRPGNGREARPPYPGWSTEQPPGQGWTAPGQQPGSTDPGGPSGLTDPEQPASWTDPQQQSGWQAPGYPGSPAQPDSGAQSDQYPPPGYPPTPPAGWGAPAWGPPPPVKPGVIPLRPLGVGEIMDGAVTTIRRNPGPMLGLSAVLAIIVQFIGLIASWLLFRDLQALETLPATASPAEVFGVVGGTVGGFGVMAIVSWVATVILTGVLTVVVSRAVLGENLTVGAAWAKARPKLPKLLLLTLVYSLIAIAPLLAVTLLMVLAAATGGGNGMIGVGVLAGFVGVALTVWLYVRYSLATPAFMLESTPGSHPGEPARPIGIGKALRRSAELVTKSWWRLFGILILVWIVAMIVTQVIGVLFSIPTFFFADPFDPESMTSLGMLSLSALGGVVSTTITAPFLAAAVALLYVDRRIRREALDVELARAAGVTIPGRTDLPPPMR
jgi:hypothetical protein